MSHPVAAPAPVDPDNPDQDRAEPKIPSGAWYSLVLLTLVYTFNNVDRRVVSIVIEPLKAEFGLTDGQMGLLTGLALGAPYALAVVPMGVLADRSNRRNMLSAVLFIWSALTAAAGFAQSYFTLFWTRMIVGVAEAGSSPAALSIISDTFPPSRRTGASAIFQSGGTIGNLLCLMVGGWVVMQFGWRAAFWVAGVPGMIIALLILFTLRNPQRGAMDAPSAADQASGFKAAIGFILGNAVILHLVFAPSLLAAGNSGIMGWSVSFLVREHGLNLAAASFAVGVCQALGTVVGIVFAGIIADRITGGAPSRIITLILACQAVAVVGCVAFLLAPTRETSLASLALYMMAGYLFLGLGYGALLNLTPAKLRATVLGVELVASNLFGYAGGPVVVGFLSDAFGSLRWAMLALVVLYIWGMLHFLRARTLAQRVAAIGVAPS
jgi:MFS family permease